MVTASMSWGAKESTGQLVDGYDSEKKQRKMNIELEMT